MDKTKWFAAQFQYIQIALNLVHNKKTCINLRLLIQRYANFDFLEKSLGIVSPTYFMYNVFCIFCYLFIFSFVLYLSLNAKSVTEALRFMKANDSYSLDLGSHFLLSSPEKLRNIGSIYAQYFKPYFIEYYFELSTV